MRSRISWSCKPPCLATTLQCYHEQGAQRTPQLSDARSDILQLAREMAESGLYRGWRSIEGRLRADGLPRVRKALDDDVRRELDQRCQTLRAPR